ncbi:hypothetical protein AB0K00_21880 [Dactylosporangium sp. NPDC049525]|uniref:hypothetical protein n=1 Tax=Dactylosporangium sp. NPDC049525 TaxID=3154730 RepID=UPI0034240B60
MTDNPPDRQFALHLGQLHRAAGAPKPASLISLGRQQQPPVKLTHQSWSDWMSGKTVPKDPKVVKFLVEHLERRVDPSVHPRRGIGWWLELHQRASAYKHANRGQTPGARPRRTVARSAYLERLRQVAPPTLVDRDADLADLAAYCTAADEAPYRWLRAPAWAGKSALMMRFVLQPPAGVQLVSFFVTGREPGQSDRSAFVDVLLEQLSALLRVPLRTDLRAANREHYLQRMLADTAEDCQRRGERLILVVDGLDEDSGVTTDPEVYSIAGLLPARPAAGMRIIVTGRPHPPLPADVPDHHPLRDVGVVRDLPPSPAAQAIRHDAERDLKKWLKGSSVQQHLLGLITVAGGGLSAADLADLTDTDMWVIEEHLRSVTSRVFLRYDGRWRRDVDVYALGHKELQRQAELFLGEWRVSECRDQLHAWTETYRQAGWPDTTPEYVLDGYFRMVSATGDLRRVLACATDQQRHLRIAALSGGDGPALAEITAGQELALRLDPVDLAALGRLAVHRHRLAIRNETIPPMLPAVWVYLGRRDRAEALARGIGELAGHRSEALSLLAEAVAEDGDYDESHRVAADITNPFVRARAFLDLAQVAADAEESAQANSWIADARNAAEAIPNGELRRLALADVAVAVAESGDYEQAMTVADEVRLSMRAYTELLPRLASVSARAGDADWVAALVDHCTAIAERSDDELRQWARMMLVRIAAAGGDLSRAEVFLHDVTDPYHRTKAFIGLVDAACDAGDDQRAADHARGAETCAGMIDQPHRDWTMPEVVGALARARQFNEAEAAVRQISDERPRHQALLALGIHLALVGEVARAEPVLRRTMQFLRSGERAWNALVEAVARTGDFEHAEALARGAPSEQQQLASLTTLARTMTAAGEHDRASRVTLAVAHAAHGRPAEPQVDAIATLAWVLFKAGHPERAMTAVATIRRMLADHSPGTEADTEPLPLGRLIASLIAQARFDDAEALLKGMTGLFQAAAGWQLVDGLVDAHRYEQAEQVVQSIDDIDERVAMMHTLAEHLLSAGNTGRAAALADEAERLAGARSADGRDAEGGGLDEGAMNVPDPTARPDPAQSDAGQEHPIPEVHSEDPDALQGARPRGWWVEQMRHVASDAAEVDDMFSAARAALNMDSDAEDDYSNRQDELVDMVCVVADCGRIDHAWKLAEQIPDRNYQSMALGQVVRAAVATGDVDVAEQIAHQIPTGWERAGGLTAVAEADSGNNARVDAALMCALNIDFAEERSEALAALAGALARAGRLGRAEAIARCVELTDVRAEALVGLAAKVGTQRGRSLIAEALTVGTWTVALEALAVASPDALLAVAEEVLRPASYR